MVSEVIKWKEGDDVINCGIVEFPDLDSILEERNFTENERKLLHHLQMIGLFGISLPWADFTEKDSTSLFKLSNNIYDNLPDCDPLKENLHEYRKILWAKGLSPFGIETGKNNVLDDEYARDIISKIPGGINAEHYNTLNLLLHGKEKSQAPPENFENIYSQRLQHHFDKAISFTEDEHMISYLQSLKLAFSVGTQEAFLKTLPFALKFNKSNPKINFYFDSYGEMYTFDGFDEPNGGIWFPTGKKAYDETLSDYFDEHETELHPLVKIKELKGDLETFITNGRGPLASGFVGPYFIKGWNFPNYSDLDKIEVVFHDSLEAYSKNFVESYDIIKSIVDLTLDGSDVERMEKIFSDLHEKIHSLKGNWRHTEQTQRKRFKELGLWYSMTEESRANVGVFKLAQMANRDGKEGYDDDTLHRLYDVWVAHTIINVINGLNESHALGENYQMNKLWEHEVIQFDGERIIVDYGQDYSKIMGAIDDIWDQLDDKIMGNLRKAVGLQVQELATKVNEEEGSSYNAFREFVGSRLLDAGCANKLAFIYPIINSDGSVTQHKDYQSYTEHMTRIIQNEPVNV